MTDFPEGFFDRADDTADPIFYAVPRLVTHIDDDAIAAVGALYEELGIDGDVLDLMSSWVSHFVTPPRTEARTRHTLRFMRRMGSTHW